MINEVAMPKPRPAPLRERDITRQIAEIQVRAALEDEHHRQAGWTVHRPNPPPFRHPDVRLVRRTAGDAVAGILTAARRFLGHRLGQLLDPQLAFEGE